MTWTQFFYGFRLDPITKGSPGALVIPRHDLGARAATLTPVAVPRAKTVPTTGLLAHNGTKQFNPPCSDTAGR
jgi:hypothetical protein